MDHLEYGRQSGGTGSALRSRPAVGRHEGAAALSLLRRPVDRAAVRPRLHHCLLYASARATQGAGPKTAAQIGLFVGFAAGFPSNFAMATWAPFPRVLSLWWMLELWFGAILASLVAGWLYRDQ
jgi:hypothetical protein